MGDIVQEAEHSTPVVGEDLGDEGSLVVEDQRFAIVPEWVITAEISDAAFRVYSMLLRFGGSSGCRMPSRALLGRRLHRSVDSIDRALRELSSAGMVRIERRRSGKQFLSNRYHVRTSAPASKPPEARGGRTSAPTPTMPGSGSRRTAATPGRTSAASVAAELRHYPEASTQSTNPPPPSGESARPRERPGTALEVADDALLAACGVTDINALSRRCIAARAALGQPGGRWTPQCLTVAIQMAVVNRGWPTANVVAALQAVAADKSTRSPVRLAEAGPWWDVAAVDTADDDLVDAESRLADVGGQRVALQARARAELSREGMPVTRSTVTRRAVQILDRAEVSA